MTTKTEGLELASRLYHLDKIGRLKLTGPASWVPPHTETIARAAGVLLRNAERRCNGIPRYDAKAGGVFASWTEEDEARAEASDAKAESRVIEALAELYGPNWKRRIDVEFQRDPRGAMVKLWKRGERDHGSPLVFV